MLTENVNDGKEFELAIVSVLSGSNVVAGNLFILKFIETEQSWISSMMICTNNDNDYIRYFAANILYTKVNKQPLTSLLKFTGNEIYSVKNYVIS